MDGGLAVLLIQIRNRIDGDNLPLMAFGKVKMSIFKEEFTLSGEDISSGTRGVGNKSVSTEVSVSHSGGDLLFIWEANEL